jgi:shikimate kinase
MRYSKVSQVGRSIVLVGMMGAGKSSVGQCLHRRTGLPLLDTDEVVASKFGTSVPEIFAKHGENKFRQAETEALCSLATTEPRIIVTGGGIVSRNKNLEVLKRLGAVVWLDGNDATLFARAARTPNRPLLQAKDPRKAFSQIHGTRRWLYERIADVRVNTSVLTAEEVAVAILSKLKKLDWKPGSSIPATT